MKIWPLPTVELRGLHEIRETRPVVLLTSAPAWNAVKDRLRLPIVWQGVVVEANIPHWERLLTDLNAQFDMGNSPILYAVGGGLVADAGKYLAQRLDLPMVCAPTALSVDAFFTWASGIREGGCVRYIQSKVPEQVVVDLEVLAAAPPMIRAAGICDVLSIATGSWDWKFAEERGMNPPEMKYIPYVAQTAGDILQGALDCAEAAGRGDPAGLKQLLDCLMLEVQLCNQVGHARPEEGSEHYFAYAVENLVGHGLPHGDLLAPGILLMAGFQGQDTAPLKRALVAAQVPLEQVPADSVEKTLEILPVYVRKHDLPYAMAHEIAQFRPGG